MVCKLLNSLYGLKETPKQWYKNYDNFMSNNGFLRCQTDHCCYVKMFDGFYIILLLYVDDMFSVGVCKHEIEKVKKKRLEEFVMKDLNAAK